MNSYDTTAENRNITQLFPGDGAGIFRNSGVRRFPINITRCCSYCHAPGHIITTCTDPRIIEFGQECLHHKIICNQGENARNNFKIWLSNYYLENITTARAFAIRTCGSTVRSNVQNNLDSILDYFYCNEFSELVIAESDDFIPFLQESDTENIRIAQAIEGIIMLQRDRFDDNLNIFYQILNRILQGNNAEIQFDIEIKLIEELNFIDELCECNICYETSNKINFVNLNCSHEFCKDCVIKTLETCDLLKNPSCAYCRSTIKYITTKSKDVKSEFIDIIM